MDRDRLWLGQGYDNNNGFSSWKDEKLWHSSQDYIDTLLSIDNWQDCECHYCGAKDGELLEIHHLDGNHSNYNESNLVPICALCHRTIHLGLCAIGNCATLHYVPNTSLVTLQDIDYAFYNLLSRFEMYCLMFQKQASSIKHAQEFLSLWQTDFGLSLKSYSQTVNAHFGVADLLNYLSQDDEYAKTFIENQKRGDKGLFFLRFNTMVFKPLHFYSYSYAINRLRQDMTLHPSSFDVLIEQALKDIKNFAGVNSKSFSRQKVKSSEVASYDSVDDTL